MIIIKLNAQTNMVGVYIRIHTAPKGTVPALPEALGDKGETKVMESMFNARHPKWDNPRNNIGTAVIRRVKKRNTTVNKSPPSCYWGTGRIGEY